MKIVSGSANIPLAEKIAAKLGLKLSPVEIHVFPDGEKRVRIEESVVDEDCIIVQPTAPPGAENYFELFFLVDSVKRSGAKSATVVMPYLGYQRQDHIFREGEAVSLAVIIKTLVSIGTNRVIAVDLHSIRIPEAFTIPITHLSALSIFAQTIKQNDWSTGSILISPDMGGIRRIKLISEMLNNMSYAAIEKNRDLNTGDVAASEFKEMHGSLKKRALIVDDMISSGRTIETAASLLVQNGVEEIHVFATHPVFSDEAPYLLQHAKVHKVFVTDSIYIPTKKHFPKLAILSIADTIAKELRMESGS